MQRYIERRELVGGSLPELSTRKLLPNLLSECMIETKGLDKVFASVCVGTFIFYGTKCGHILVWMALTAKPIVIYEGKDPIHSLAVCPQKSWVAATAGARILLFRLPDFVLTHTLNCHEDTVFSVAFVSDFTLVSVSRDTTICFWNILDPCLTLKLNAHGAKVRNLAFSSSRKELGTISADGFIKLWDSQSAHLLHSLPLAYNKEAIALANQNYLYAVGSQHHISLIDSRIPAYLTHFDSVDEGWGVRSLSLDQNIVTVGGGKGYLSFFDLRAQKYVPLRPGMRLSNTISAPASFKSFHHDEKLPKRRSAWKVSSGWLNKNQMYYDYFQGLNIRNAIYTHCYHANSTEIFVAGGPLQLNLSGSYAAIWK